MINSLAGAGVPRIAFIPVSGKYGMGEYARSLAIARAAQARWPQAQVHFLVSSQAPYATDMPFEATLLPSSPTLNTPAVIAWLQTWRPTLVIFDNAGRTRQLQAARQLGARVVYISARSRQRRKAFRLRWMRMLDEHWIAYPEFIAGALRFSERCKLRLLGRPQVRYLDVIFSRGAARRGAQLLEQWGCGVEQYVVFVPGGGTGHPGAVDANAQFLEAARLAARQGCRCVFVGGAAEHQDGDAVIRVGSLPQADLAQLLANARVVVANGGSTLLQAIACLRPCVAIGIADDQAARIASCVAAGVALAAPARADAIAPLVLRLWSGTEERAAMMQRARALALADGIEVAMAALQRLLDGSG